MMCAQTEDAPPPRYQYGIKGNIHVVCFIGGWGGQKEEEPPRCHTIKLNVTSAEVTFPAFIRNL